MVLIPGDIADGIFQARTRPGRAIRDDAQSQACGAPETGRPAGPRRDGRCRKTRRGGTAGGGRRQQCQAWPGRDRAPRRRERAKALRAELADADEQVASTERTLADARAQRDRDLMADQIEAMAAAIEQAGPGFDAGAAALVNAVTRSATSVPEATRFSASVDAVRREVLAATDLICWELRSAAVRTRAGNANIAAGVTAEPQPAP